MKLGRIIQFSPAGRWWVGVAIVGLHATFATAQVETVPIHFSKPFEPILSTNLDSLVGAEQKKGFQELLRETDNRGISSLFREEITITPLAPSSRPRLSPAAAQKYREAADRKKNWVFTIEDDAQNDPKVSQLLKFLDADAQAGTDKQRSIYQNFYDRLEREGARPANSANADANSPDTGDGNSSDNSLLNGPTGNAFTGAPLNGPGSARDLLGNRPVGAGDRGAFSGAKSRDPLNLAAKRDTLSTASTRQVADFKTFDRESSTDAFSTPSQRARFDAFKGLFDSKPAASAVALSQPKPAVSSAMSGLTLPSAASAFSSPGPSSYSPSKSFDSAPAWKSSAPASLPLPSYSSPQPSTPSRISTPFPTVPTRRQ